MASGVPARSFRVVRRTSSAWSSDLPARAGLRSRQPVALQLGGVAAEVGRQHEGASYRRGRSARGAQLLVQRGAVPAELVRREAYSVPDVGVARGQRQGA